MVQRNESDGARATGTLQLAPPPRGVEDGGTTSSKRADRNGSGPVESSSSTAGAVRAVAIRGCSPRAVAQVTAFLCSIAAATILLAMFAFWVVASIAGVVGGVERFLHEVGFVGFRFMSFPVISALALVSISGIAIITSVVTLMSVAYNWYADQIACVELDVDDVPRSSADGVR